MILKTLLYTFLAIILFALIITAITLIFDGYNLTAYPEKTQKRVVNTLRDSELDQLIDRILAKNPNQTGLMLLDSNLDAFTTRAISARSATRSLDLQYYIWHSDLTGKLLGHELLKAADRGVHVRLLVDDMNANDKDAIFSALVEHPNIEIRLFNPIYSRQNFVTRSVEMLFRGLSLNRRMHNKAWIVDDNIAIIGGRNIGNEYFDADLNTNFFDVDVLLIGVGVDETKAIFEEFWRSKAVVPFKKIVKKQRQSLESLRSYAQNIPPDQQLHAERYWEQIRQSPNIRTLLNKEQTIYWTDKAHVYSDPPEKVFDQKKSQWLLNNIFLPLQTAKKEIYLISPYFVPGTEGVKKLAELKDEGINIKILTNSLAATDVLMVHGGYARYRIPLLQKGIDIFELIPYNVIKKKGLGAKGISLHTKIFIIDDQKSFIGSFNLDPRSARLNTEMGIYFEQKEIISELLTLYTNKVGQKNSYRLFLEKGKKLRWEDGSMNIEGSKEKKSSKKIWRHEPETSLFKRMLTKIVSWLPIESQL